MVNMSRTTSSLGQSSTWQANSLPDPGHEKTETHKLQSLAKHQQCETLTGHICLTSLYLFIKYFTLSQHDEQNIFQFSSQIIIMFVGARQTGNSFHRIIRKGESSSSSSSSYSQPTTHRGQQLRSSRDYENMNSVDYLNVFQLE